jgi:hypothetical protein
MGTPERLKVFIGFDPREMAATVVADHSLKRHCPTADSNYVSILNLKHRGWYTRPTVVKPDGSLWDTLSEAPMSTEHAIARFFVPMLCEYEGWALFVDGDVLFRESIDRLFALRDPSKAVQVVQHPPLPAGGTKKDGAVQQPYPRKNWSSVMLFNCAHPGNRLLGLGILNAWPGRDLHAFNWLVGSDVGALPATWNHLVNVSAPMEDPALVHFTLGIPTLPGHDRDPFADEWFDVARMAGYGFERTRESA